MQTHRVNGIDFQVRDGSQGEWDKYVVNEVVASDCYRISGWCPNNRARVVDVGAHIGSFAKWTATRLPLSEVWAFEMMSENLAILRCNVAGLPNVRVHDAALGDRIGFVSSGAMGENTGGTAADWTTQGNIPAFDVADLFSEWPYIDCLKLDCEGSEFQILERIASLPGGIRARVGCVRAEVHAATGSPKHVALMRLLTDAFPRTDEKRETNGSPLGLAWGWR